jgi:hypothetical protein
MSFAARLTALLGRTLNALRLPGFVRNARYVSPWLDAHVQVHCGEAFTGITVNEIDVYFDRLSGRIDGVARNTREARGTPAQSQEA